MRRMHLARQQKNRQRRRRLAAAALCAMSFFTSQALFGREPAAGPTAAPSLLSEYSKAKGQVAATPASQSVAWAVATEQKSQKPQPAVALEALPGASSAAKSLRPAALEAVSEMTLEAAPAEADSAASTTAAKPTSEAEQLPPIVPAWAMPRPTRKLPAAASSQSSALSAAAPRIELGQVERPRAEPAPAALQTQTLSTMKPLDQRPDLSRSSEATGRASLASKPLPQILAMPGSKPAFEPATVKPGFQMPPVAERPKPHFAETKPAEVAAPLPASSQAAASGSPATTGAAQASAPLEIYNPNVQRPAPQAVAKIPASMTATLPATAAPAQPQAGIEPPGVATLPALAAQGLEPPKHQTEKPAEPGAAAAPAPSAARAAVIRANEAGVASAKAKPSIQTLLNVAANENPAVQKADFETRVNEQPLRPELLPERAEGLGVLPPDSPFEAIEQSGTVKLRVRRSILLRTKVDVYRTAIVDDTVCDIVQFTPREVSIIGRAVGQTHVTFWLDEAGSAPLTYLVDVQPDPQQIKADESKYELLQNVINEMFPDSKVYLVLVADKLLVKGQAKDSEEAAQIMTIVRAQASGVTNGAFPGAGIAQGAATPVLSTAATGGTPGPAYQVINMLRVPGVQQVALRVKIAELNRSAARGFGVDVNTAISFSDSAKATQLFLASMLNGSSTGNAGGNGGTAVVTSFSGQEVNVGLRYLQERGVIRLLSEPTLVTLSGRPATFIAGGEFAVPTVVGSVGLNAVTTDFRAFGAIISFLPTVVDKDRIRLQVAPEFSQINTQLTSNNTPGLNVRAATTTVEMREGQTLAIAGLLEDTYKATNVGDLPGLAKIFGRRDTSRNETELIILVTPELVHPMEAEEVPPLPGFDVTEPTASQFFLHGEIEGNPTQDYRSTVWPRLRRRYGMGGPAMTSGPFGHGQ